MQIRLTVVDPLGSPAPARGRAASRDVLVTAPAGTALAAVAPALAAAVTGEGGHTPAERGRESGGAPVVLYAGAQRLDAQRCTLGVPPLVDGAVLSVGAPGEPEPHPELDDAPTQLHVIAGPDAGGVHLLHGGEIRIGRSADADIPLDDPDVSRLHCAVTVAADGRVSVADLGSTNGTALDGTRVGPRPVRLAPGALLRIGESALRLAPTGGPGARVETAPDGEGHVRVPAADGEGHVRSAVAGTGTPHARGPGTPTTNGTSHAYGTADWVSAADTSAADTQGHAVPGQGGAPRIERRAGSGAPGAGSAGDASEAARAGASRAGSGEGDPHGGRAGVGAFGDADGSRAGSGDAPRVGARDGDTHGGTAGAGAVGSRFEAGGAGDPGGAVSRPLAADGNGSGAAALDDRSGREGGRKATPIRGTDVPQGVRRRGGLAAWARRLAGGRVEPAADGRREYYDDKSAGVAAETSAVVPGVPETWPDPATLLLAALGPGPRLWERGPGHPEALAVRLGTADRTAPDGSGLLPAVPVTAGLCEVGALGLAGPRGRLGGLARAVLAQLAALHSPDTLEIVLISADRSRPLEERTAEWSWLGWLPHVRPGHGQDCRLLLAYDREQAMARTAELLRRLEDHPTQTRAAARPTAPGERTTDRADLAGVPSSSGTPGPSGATASGAGGTGGTPGSAATGPGATGSRATGSGAAASDAMSSDSARISGTQGSPAANAAPQYGTAAQAAAPTSGDTHPAPAPTPDAPHRGAPRRPSWARDDDRADEANGFPGPYTVVVVDGDPGGADLRDAVARLALEGPRAGIHVVCLAETAAASPASPVTETYEAACAVAPTFRDCSAVALLSGDVATALRLLRVARTGGTGASAASPADQRRAAPGNSDRRPTAPSCTDQWHPAPGTGPAPGPGDQHPTDRHPAAHNAPHSPGPVGHGTIAAVDAVSPAWAERFARALAPLRADGGGARHACVAAPLPQAARLLDELGLARATPASLMARWADAADDTAALGGRVCAVLGAGPRGPVCADLVAEGPHLLIEGPAGSGRTELLRAVVASLAAAERPDRLGIVLVDGRDGAGPGGGHGDGLRVCTDVPHVTTYLSANDPVRMREFAQSLSAELKRRAELLGRSDFTEWHTGRELSGRMVAQRTAAARGASGSGPVSGAAARASGGADDGSGDLDTPPSSTLRLRPGAARRRTEAAPPLPRLVVVVDDLDALVSPALGSPGRPAAGSVIRALEAVAREGARLGVHLVAAAGPGGRTAQTEPARRAALRVALDAPAAGTDEPAPGRGRLTRADGRVTAFQGGRVTGRIPRTATLRPTVVPLDWHRMGDPPTRRPVRELGNGPTDLALLASALERAAREVASLKVASLL
ncbi:FHA domain-containing protein [Streptomyces sp. TRM68367]|uniref:FHA domain-containing protein n=1 Tax=Streptomyces sp. TRM68367 TaxID=2758415 RepID=UPI00165CE961|nr:FHA domain-containing protein [Streptomyces sp. TRM68367]MBC9725504.1 FHA domain-containing protein [Streptomyces sp. TRM68367]